MSHPLSNFTDAAKSLGRSPLGIIALFIILIYGVAALVLGTTAESLSEALKAPLVWFLVGFPVLVLAIFGWLVSGHHTKLYGPSDFADQKLFIELQAQVRTTQRRLNVLAEVTPNVLISSLEPERPSIPTRRAMSERARVGLPGPRDEDDPQAGRWTGQREDKYRVVSAGPIRALHSDPANFRVPLEVRSSDPINHPLEGPVRFYLHHSFSPNVEEVSVVEGAAKLTLVAYGAFTVGVEIEDGTHLELNLADPDIDAPSSFKEA
ncbi:MAG: hypothetical protein H0T90_09460 [Gemmatimonadales bacterium]|nr:hypothetical protein [Gemmatimonadales bacterium]